MLGIFPTPYPDELLYSVIARYYAWSPSTSPHVFLQELFGKSSFAASFDLPTRLEILIQKLPVGSKLTAENFIHKNTLYPFYAPFLLPGKSKTIFNLMLGQTFQSVHMEAGVLAYALPRIIFFRFCPTCLSEDTEKYGEPYWHRSHQITGIYVCPTHKVWLRNSNVKVTGEDRRKFTAAEAENCTSELTIANSSKETFNKLVLLAQDVNSILSQSFAPQDANWFKEQYRSLLIDKGLAALTGKIYQRKLTQEFIDFYGNEFLQLVYSDFNPESEVNWVRSITRKTTVAHNPIRHLLLTRFLNKDTSTIFKTICRNKPFGNGPWTCFNAAAKHYLEKVVTSISISYCYTNKKMVGRFSCACGFIYSTRNRALAFGKKGKPTSIKTFGEIWEGKLKQLLFEEKVSYSEAGRRLNVGKTTIKTCATRLKIITAKEESTKIQTDFKLKDRNDLTKKRRILWLKAQKKHPTFSKTELSAKFSSIFCWLRKYDLNWLNTNSPKKKQRIFTKQKVDWASRDEETLLSVKNAVEIVRKQSPPIKINISSVANQLNLAGLLKNQLHKIPKTKKFLLSQRESTQQIQIRRIYWAARDLALRGEFISKWKVLEVATIRDRTNILQRIADIAASEVNPKI